MGSDNKEKNFDPEIDIKFTVDQQVDDYFKGKNVKKREILAEEDISFTNVDDEEIEVKDDSDRYEIDEVEEGSSANIDLLALNESSDEEGEEGEEGEVRSRLVLFDYKSEFFSYLIKEIDDGLDYVIVKDFEDLPKEFQKNDSTLLFLNFSAYPKLCQQMIPKVKEKYPDVNMILVAKNLTEDKVKNHKESPYGVSDYLSFPFSKEDFMSVLMKYN